MKTATKNPKKQIVDTQRRSGKAEADKNRKKTKQKAPTSNSRMKHNIYSGTSDINPTSDKKQTTSRKTRSAKKPKPRIVDTYDYRDPDENQELLYQNVRFEPKDFRFRRPNPEIPPDPDNPLDPNDPNDQKHWLKPWGLGKNPKWVLYHLSEWLKASKQDWQYIVEGEKDVKTLEKLGFPATTNPMGALKWKPEYNKYCKDRLIVIICHRDEPGERHGRQVATSLHGTAAQIKLVFLDPDMPEHSDVTDLVEKHNWTAKDFLDLIEKTPVFEPEEKGSQLISKKTKRHRTRTGTLALVRSVSTG
ncbi:unnamed protein product, partial [marine sediment metagenome]